MKLTILKYQKKAKISKRINKIKWLCLLINLTDYAFFIQYFYRIKNGKLSVFLRQSVPLATARSGSSAT